MDFSLLIDSILSYLQANLLVTILLAIVLLFILYRWPGAFFMIVIITALLLGILYLISNISSTGGSYKRTLIHKDVSP